MLQAQYWQRPSLALWRGNARQILHCLACPCSADPFLSPGGVSASTTSFVQLIVGALTTALFFVFLAVIIDGTIPSLPRGRSLGFPGAGLLFCVGFPFCLLFWCWFCVFPAMAIAPWLPCLVVGGPGGGGSHNLCRRYVLHPDVHVRASP